MIRDRNSRKWQGSSGRTRHYSLTGYENPVSVSLLRIVLVIFALWVLVVEPTFGAYERFEQESSQGERPSDEASSDLDQPIPPGQVVAPCWENHHVLDILAMPLLDPVNLASPLDLLGATLSPGLLPAEFCMPYPPSALPLRL